MLDNKIPAQDMAGRLCPIQKILANQGLDALWVIGDANRRYLTGFSGSAGWVILPAQGKPWLITDGRYTLQAKQEISYCNLITFRQNPFTTLAELLIRQDWLKLGLEDDKLSVRDLHKLRRCVKKLKPKPTDGIVESRRGLKSALEINCLRQAVIMAEKAYQRIISKIKPGITEQALAFELERAMLAVGSQGPAFPTIVASGPNSALPHAQPGSRLLKKGDLLVLDFGCVFRGYHSDLTRTVAIAKMTARQKELYKIVKNAQKTGANHLISGKFASESDHKCRSILRKARLERYFVHSFGHGLGLEIHENPRLTSFSKDILASGMIVTCEPGIYLPGWGGIRIEDDLLVRENSNQWLSQSPEELTTAG